jgi:hypothetical protein
MRAFDGADSFRESITVRAFFLPLLEFISEAIGIVRGTEAPVCDQTVGIDARARVRVCVVHRTRHLFENAFSVASTVSDASADISLNCRTLAVRTKRYGLLLSSCVYSCVFT